MLQPGGKQLYRSASVDIEYVIFVTFSKSITTLFLELLLNIGGILMPDIGDYAVLIISAIVGVIIGVTAFLQTAPTISTLTATACTSGVNCTTELQNAGVTSSTLAGVVYSFYPVVWAIGGFAVVASVLFLGKKHVGA